MNKNRTSLIGLRIQVVVLSGSWYQLTKAFGLSENDETYDSLLAAYSEKHRAYHRLEHISACFRHLDIVS